MSCKQPKQHLRRPAGNEFPIADRRVTSIDGACRLEAQAMNLAADATNRLPRWPRQATSAAAPVAGRWRWVAATFSLFLALVVVRWEIVASPPYYDFALGVFTEANFLVDSGFDYLRLANSEPTGNDGGPRVYLISALPTILACMMKLAPSTRMVLVVCHLFSFACASVLIVTLYALLRSLAGTAAALTAVAIMATSPLFSTQVDMLGIDLPMTTAAVVMIYLASRRRLLLASLAATAAFACKPSGLIVTAALLGYDFCLLGALAWRSGLRDRTLLTTVAAIVWTIALLFAQLLIYRWSNLGDRLEDLARASGYLGAVLSLCPDQCVVMVLATVGTLVAVARGLMCRWRPDVGSARPEDPQAIARALLLVAAWLVVAATMTSIVVYVRVYSVRYLLLALPFLYAILAVTVLRHLNSRALSVVAALAVALNLANWNGYFFPTVNVFRRHCSALERSHEYLADHRSNIAAMRELESKYADDAIVAGFPFPYFLSYPRLGYVSRPLHGYSINPFAGAAFPQVARLFDNPPARLTLIRVDNPNYVSGAVELPPPAVGDEILYDDRQAAPLVVYRRQLPAASDDSSRARSNWLLEQLWLGTSGDSRSTAGLLLRAQWLGKYHPAEALELLSKANVPDKLEVRLLRGQLLLQTNRAREAVETLYAAAHQYPTDPDVQLRLGEAYVAAGDINQARRAFEETARLNAQSATAWLRLGILSLQSGQSAEAVGQLRRAITIAPLDPISHNALGVALANRGDWQAARAAFLRAVELDPHLREARQNLAEADRMLRSATPPTGAAARN